MAAVAICRADGRLAHRAAAGVVASRHGGADRHRSRRGLRRGRARGARVPAGVLAGGTRFRRASLQGARRFCARREGRGRPRESVERGPRRVDVHRRGRRGRRAIRESPRQPSGVSARLPLGPAAARAAAGCRGRRPSAGRFSAPQRGRLRWRVARSSADGFFAMLARVMPGRRAVGRAVVDAAHSPPAVRASRRRPGAGSVSPRARRGGSIGALHSRHRPGLLDERRTGHAAARPVLPAATAARWRAASAAIRTSRRTGSSASG